MSVGVGTNYYSAFNPLNLGDCALWLDAADTSTLTLSGSNVTQWNDKSGNGRNTTAVTGTPVLSNNAVNSRRGIYFNGSSYFTGNFSYSSNTLTWFIVGTMESGTSSFGRLLSFGNSGVLDYDNVTRINACSRFDVTNELVSYRGTGYIIRNAFVTYGYPFIFSSGIDGTTNYPFFNTSAVTGGATSGNFGFSQYTIATGSGSTGGTSTGHIFEILVYSSFLSTAQRQQIEGYLADKWNLRVNLPGVRSGILPTNIYGLQLWLDGTDSSTMTLSGSNVTQWNDKSGNGRNTTAVYGTPQLKTDGGFNGLSAVYFGASAAFTGPITNGTSNLSVFVVARLNDVANPRRFFTLGASGRLDYDNASDIAALTTGNSTSELTFYRNYAASGYQTAIVTPVYNAPFVYSLQLGNGTGRIYRDFTTTASAGNNGVFGYTTYAVAAGFTPTIGNYLGNGYIAEILVYNTVLSENERQDLNNYFATKYARTYTPPVSHIYKSIKPVTRGFAPVDIPNCALWLDAADPNSVTFSSGSNISQWSDKSGNNRNASQFNTGFATYNGSNQVTITTTGQLSCSIPSGTFSAGISAFIVFKSYSTVGTSALITRTIANIPAPFDMYTYSTATTARIIGNGTQFASYDTTSTLFRNTETTLYGFFLEANLVWNESVNGTYATIPISYNSGGAAYADNGSNVVIGSRSDKNTSASIYVYEVILYNGFIPSFQRQQVEGYLARKWRLNAGTTQSIVNLNPTSISNCAIWLDAADSASIDLSGTNVTTWRDKSGNNRNFTASGTGAIYGTTNSYAGLTFSNNAYTSTYTSAVTNETMIAVLQFVNTGFVSIIGTTAAGGRVLGIYNGNQIGITNLGVAWGAITPASANTSLLVSALVTSGSTTQVATYGSTSFASSNITAFSAGTTTIDGGWQGVLREVLAFSRVLTTTERQQVEGYLAWKWGLQGNLPGSHPYASQGLPSTHPFISRLPATTVFNPRQIANCGFWFDAADPSTFTYQSGSNVSIWTDKTTGIQAQYSVAAGSVNYPVSGSNINGRNALFFNQSSLLATPTQSVSTRSYFAVLQILSPNTNPDGNILWPGTTVGGFARGGSINVNSTNIIFANQNVANLLNLAYTVGSPLILSITFNNGTVGMWNTGGGTTTSTGQSSSRLGFSGSTDNVIYIGGVGGVYTTSGFLLGEFLEYNAALSTFERQQVEGYLAWKWRLNGGYSPSLTPFTPTSVTGCALWLDATDSTSFTFSSGSNISQWRDKVSGLVGSGVNSPTLVSSSLNGFASVNFNGTNQYVDFGNIVNLGTSQIYIFVVSQYNSTASGTLVGKTSYRGLAGRWGITRDTGSGGMFMLADATGSGVVAAFADTSTSARLLTGYWDRSNLYILQNGTQQATAVLSSAANLSTTDPLYVGAYPNSTGTGPQAGFYLNGKIGEILVYLGSLTTANRQTIEGYLAMKWGLQGSLPSSHPYANRSIPSTHPYKLIKP